MSQLGFLKCTSEHGVDVHKAKSVEMLIVCLYVDDLLITGSDETEIKRFRENMLSEFEMSDLGELLNFLGIEFLRTERGNVFKSKKVSW